MCGEFLWMAADMLFDDAARKSSDPGCCERRTSIHRFKQDSAATQDGNQICTTSQVASTPSRLGQDQTFTKSSIKFEFPVRRPSSLVRNISHSLEKGYEGLLIDREIEFDR